MNNYIKEIKAILVFASIGLIIFFFLFLIEHFKILNYILGGFLIYLMVAVPLAVIRTQIKSKVLGKIVEIIIIPSEIIMGLATIFIPFGFLFIHIIYYVGFVIIPPTIFFKVFKIYNFTIINNIETIMYIKLTVSVFIAVLFNYQLRKLIYKISPARIKSSKKLKPYQLDKLTDYLLSENNVRFIIYAIYVILLIAINFNNFEENYLTQNIITDKAILQSFVTFIALDRALALLKQLEFKPSDLLTKIVQSISDKIKDTE